MGGPLLDWGGFRLVTAVSAALENVANESDGPVAVEIRQTFVEVNFGMSWEQALDNLSRRMPLACMMWLLASIRP